MDALLLFSLSLLVAPPLEELRFVSVNEGPPPVLVLFCPPPTIPNLFFSKKNIFIFFTNLSKNK